MELIDSHVDNYYKRETYLLERRETDTQVIEKQLEKTECRTTGEKRETLHTVKQQKFLCVNGPLVGKKETLEKAEVLGYARYNCGESGHRWGAKKHLPKCVLVKF